MKKLRISPENEKLFEELSKFSGIENNSNNFNFFLTNAMSKHLEELTELKYKEKEDIGNYYDEGDICPKCKKDTLVLIGPSEASGGLSELRCQGCNYDATEDEKNE